MFIKVPENIYPYTLNDLYRDNKDTSFPSILTDRLLAEYGLYKVKLVEAPIYDPLTQKLVEGVPVLLDGVWTQQWSTQPLTTEEQTVVKNKRIAEFEKALDDHLDSKARERRYNDRFTCALRAGYQGPYQTEGMVFAAWMDACNYKAYTILNEILTGGRQPPRTVEEFISQLPTLEWPN